MELKKPHPSRLVGGAEIQNGLVSYPNVVEKIQEKYFGSKESQPHIRPPSPGFQCQEDKHPYLLDQKSVGIEAMEETSGIPSSSS